MSEVSNTIIDAQIQNALSGGSDRVKWTTELKNILENLNDSKINLDEKGVADGVATLDSAGLIPASQLPSYVDDVLEFADFASLPVTGESGKIYITLDDGLQYRWTGSIYVSISSGPGVASMGDLTDVDLTGLSVGDVLKWNGTDWVPSDDDDSEVGAAAPLSGSYVSGAGVVTPGDTIEEAIEKLDGNIDFTQGQIAASSSGNNLFNYYNFK